MKGRWYEAVGGLGRIVAAMIREERE